MDELTTPPPLKTDPKYGYYPHWPQDGDDWLHPEDVALARRLLPSHRIWRRGSDRGEFHTLRYGDLVLRVRSALWQEVPQPEFEIGDWVEVRTRMMKNEPHTGQVTEMEWDERQRSVVYHIQENDKPIPTRYTIDDLAPVAPTTNFHHSTLPADTPEATEGVDELVEGLPKDENFGPPKRR